MKAEELKQKIIENAVKNLHEFGYVYADKENIFTDGIYKEFFKSMLKDNLGKSTSLVDTVINQLLSEL